MKTLKELADSIDYKLLKEQKEVLFQFILRADDIFSEETSTMEGILSLIDTLQDTIVEAELKTEEEVFGKNL